MALALPGEFILTLHRPSGTSEAVLQPSKLGQQPIVPTKITRLANSMFNKIMTKRSSVQQAQTATGDLAPTGKKSCGQKQSLPALPVESRLARESNTRKGKAKPTDASNDDTVSSLRARLQRRDREWERQKKIFQAQLEQRRQERDIAQTHLTRTHDKLTAMQHQLAQHLTPRQELGQCSPLTQLLARRIVLQSLQSAHSKSSTRDLPDLTVSHDDAKFEQILLASDPSAEARSAYDRGACTSAVVDAVSLVLDAARVLLKTTTNAEIAPEQ